MPFHSASFAWFLPAVLAAFALASPRSRADVLLGASLLFYAASGAAHLLAILALVLAITYAAALRIAAAADERARRLVLWLAVAGDAGLLVAVRVLAGVSRPGGVLPSPFVTLGVSYYVLQAISYLVDVYMGAVGPERRARRLALYLCFFPRLVQGPIERAEHLLPQLEAPGDLRADDLRAGMTRFALGLFQKLVIADRLAAYVDYVYENARAHSGLVLAIGTWLFALQLYFDFAGYTHMALGCARMLGIRLSENFNHPFRAASVADFWRRWHMSLSQWLLDYVFKPLQIAWRGLATWGTALALLATFLVSGLWHGSGATFAVWGLLHGLYLASAVALRPAARRVNRALGLEGTRLLGAWQVFVTFQLVSFAWIFFRARTLPEAIHVVTHLGPGLVGLRGLVLAAGQREALVTALLLLGMAGLTLRRRLAGGPAGGDADPRPWGRLEWVKGYALLVATMVLGRFTAQSFIYANF